MQINPYILKVYEIGMLSDRRAPDMFTLATDLYQITNKCFDHYYAKSNTTVATCQTQWNDARTSTQFQ